MEMRVFTTGFFYTKWVFSMSKTQNHSKQLAAFQELISPPAPSKSRPADRSSVAHSLVEHLGTTLPPDYMDFAAIYGEVRFGTHDHYQLIRVFSPWSKRYYKALSGLISVYTELRQSEGTKYIPFPLHPDRPGLLPWGLGDNRRAYFWYTEGGPELWKVVYLTPEDKFVRTDKSFLPFMIELFNGQFDLGGDTSRKWWIANKANLVCNRVKQ